MTGATGGQAAHDRLANRFAAACRAGDVVSLAAVLAVDAVVVCDGGGTVPAAVRPIDGADRVARFVAALPAALLAGEGDGVLAAEQVNGRTGLVLRHAGRAIAVISLSTTAAEVTAVWIVLNPDKLTRWHLR